MSYRATSNQYGNGYGSGYLSAPNAMGQRYRISPMVSASSVHWALESSKYKPEGGDPEYAKAVFKSYITLKQHRGKGKQEISYKLGLLERELPSYASAFHAVRAEMGLPPSPYLRPSSSANNLRRAQTTTGATSTAGHPGHVRTGGLTTFTVDTNRPRIVSSSSAALATRPTGEDEPPPPPYMANDPEPDSTRMLQERLAAEAEAAGTLAPDSPASTPARSSFSASTSQRPVTVYPVPPGPPPARREDRAPTPDEPPEDEEMRRAWEESVLEEAKRASLASERERKELEEAMKLSLADAERAPPQSNEAGPSHRRTVSDAGFASGMERLSVGAPSMPGGFVHDLLDDSSDEELPGQMQGGGMQPLQPERTGAGTGKLGSRNPFLSAAEREQLQADEEAQGEGMLTPSQGTRSRVSSATYTPPNPGSSRTKYEIASPISPTASPSQGQERPPKPLPRPPKPDEPRYDPPPPSLGAQPTGEAPRLPPRPGSLAVGGGGGAGAGGFPWTDGPPHGMGNSSTQQQLPSPFPPQPRASTPHGQTPMPIGHEVAPQAEQPAGTAEDPLALLKGYDTVFLVDDSASMAGERWAQARQALMDVADTAARYDEDGVDVYFLNSKRVGRELRGRADVEDLFSGMVPKGPTPTGARIEVVLREYMSRLERSLVTSPTSEVPPEGEDAEREHVKPMNLVVISGGVPSDDPASVLVTTAKRLDRGDYPLSHVGVQFLQIGNDGETREALQELENRLEATQGMRNMVDVVPYTGQDVSADLIIKTLLEGIHRRSGM